MNDLIQRIIKDGEENELSRYDVLFSPETTRNWQKEELFNVAFIRCQEQFANNLLRLRGYLFLNEVHDMLGVPYTSLGAIVGWTLSTNGGNFVDFGAKHFGPNLQLSFNVEGIIFHKIDKE